MRDEARRQEAGQKVKQRESWPKVAIVVLNWNGWRETIGCLESLQDITYPHYQIVVVDNGSTDYSVHRIRAWAAGNLHLEPEHARGPSLRPLRVVTYAERDARLGGRQKEERALEGVPAARRLVMIVNEANLGFAAGNNVAIRYALERGFPYVNLMNNDVVVESSYLTTLVQTLEHDSRWSGVGPKILHAAPEHTIWYAGGWPKLWRAGADRIGLGQPDGPKWSGVHDTGYVPGCCLLAKSSLFASVGLLDEDYFFGAEDIDYALRARRNGFRFAVNLDARVYHRPGIRLSDDDAMRAYHFNKYRLLLLRKRGTPVQRLIGFFVFALTRVPKFARLCVQRRWGLLRQELQALWDFLLGRYGAYDRLQARLAGTSRGRARSEGVGDDAWQDG